MESELEVLCKEIGVTISSKYLGLEEVEKLKDGKTYYKDTWSCTLSYQGREATFDYFSGIGSRKLSAEWKKIGQDKYEYIHRINRYIKFAVGIKEACEYGALVLKSPSVADVLYCILSDANACDTPFEEWCDNYGYDNDSIKALNTYLSCQKNGMKVIGLVGNDLFKKLQSAKH